MPSSIVFVGNGVAAVTAARALRARDATSSITLVSDESDYFFSRTALMYAFMDTLTRAQLEPHPRRAWDALGITRVRGRVVDLDADTKTLTLGDGRSLSYHQCVLATGSVARKLSAQGLDACKQGVVSFVTMGDLDACEALISTTREAVVVGGGLIGIELVECLLHFGVRVTWLLRDPWYWPAALGKEEGERVTAMVRAKGVELIVNDTVAHVEADATGRIARVTTTAGRTIGCQFFGVAIGVEQQVAWLRSVKTPPAMGRGVKVSATMQTSLASVWAAGDCAELASGAVEQTWYAAKAQGEVVGANVGAHHPRAYVPSRFYNSAKLFDVEYTTVGDFPKGPGVSSVFRAHPRRFLTQRIVAQEGRVVGFNLLGSRWEHNLLSQWIDDERSLSWVLDNLHRAQWDGDLARADLRTMTETRHEGA